MIHLRYVCCKVVSYKYQVNYDFQTLPSDGEIVITKLLVLRIKEVPRQCSQLMEIVICVSHLPYHYSYFVKFVTFFVCYVSSSLTMVTNSKPVCVGTTPKEVVPEECTAHLHIQRKSLRSECYLRTLLW